MNVKQLGTVSKIHSSGIVESDKGFKYPYSRAKVGDMMIDVDGSRRIVSKEEFKANYADAAKATAAKEKASLTAKAEAKAKAEAEAKAPKQGVKKEETNA